MTSSMQSGFISRSVMQDYKSLCAAVMVCATLVNIETDRQTVFDQLLWTAQLS